MSCFDIYFPVLFGFIKERKRGERTVIGDLTKHGVQDLVSCILSFFRRLVFVFFFFFFFFCENIFSPYICMGQGLARVPFHLSLLLSSYPKGLYRYSRPRNLVSACGFHILSFVLRCSCLHIVLIPNARVARSAIVPYIYTYALLTQHVLFPANSFCFLLSHPVIITSDTLPKLLSLASPFSLLSLILTCRSLHLT
ncbi:hypothetical protein BDV27DRAFT_8397 [Aspergillus caelatus]|uniref:Uncharacterized protein n=1 Tax=Aspergillus caelatus TaxID=61420 RepID=A0A5N7A183_9EURO|nr:uncharacterized protein BDV27DRAFT_8397 [Aspergillus caelatus]KAE8363313.1 hypothetical protein BDV27DRAFT_8397 [Aspergillus caelatus]